MPLLLLSFTALAAATYTHTKTNNKRKKKRPGKYIISNPIFWFKIWTEMQ
jgi:hypothetical protein